MTMECHEGTWLEQNSFLAIFIHKLLRHVVPAEGLQQQRVRCDVVEVWRCWTRFNFALLSRFTIVLSIAFASWVLTPPCIYLNLRTNLRRWLVDIYTVSVSNTWGFSGNAGDSGVRRQVNGEAQIRKKTERCRRIWRFSHAHTEYDELWFRVNIIRTRKTIHCNFCRCHIFKFIFTLM